MEPVMLHMFILGPVGDGGMERVFTAGDPGHFNVELRQKFITRLQRDGALVVKFKGVVAEKGFPPVVAEGKTHDGRADIFKGGDPDLQ